VRVLPISDGGQRAVDFVGGISFAGGAVLDVTDNGIVIGGTTEAAIRDLIIAGRNGGAWNGPGITSSVAAASIGQDDVVGYALAGSLFGISGNQTATFMGKTVGPTDMLVRYTVTGDANLDGVVDGDDLVRWTSGFGFGAFHSQGDADFDQDVDGADFLIWQRQMGRTVTVAAVVVPEPDALTMLAVLGVVCCACRTGALK
jgi:hypothetical protein